MADHKSGRSRSTAYLKCNSILYGGNMEMNMPLLMVMKDRISEKWFFKNNYYIEQQMRKI